MSTITSRIRRAWNLFRKDEEEPFVPYETGFHSGLSSFNSRPHTIRPFRGGERTIVASVYNRIAVDATSVEIRHIREVNGRFSEVINSPLNVCLSLDANIDQTGRSLRQDIVMTMIAKGVVAVVPIETDGDPTLSDSYDIYNLRVGEIVEWLPRQIRVSLYDERDGRRKEILVDKRMAAIIENPFYDIMNEPNSTLQRLIKKLAYLDIADEQATSGKLDIIIQLPYVVKSDQRIAQAEKRRKDIEVQLRGSQYGIAYIDGTERITQLNRPAENTLLKQIEYLSASLYSQLGITQSILDGTASMNSMTNYHNRTIKPILEAIAEEMERKFLTKTARTQGQTIEAYRDPFQLVNVMDMPAIADALIRNKILTANEVRSIIGVPPSDDETADMLNNPNVPDGKADAGSGAAKNLLSINKQSPDEPDPSSLPDFVDKSSDN